MNRTQLRRMLAVVARLVVVLSLLVLPPTVRVTGQGSGSTVSSWQQLINSQQGYALQYPVGSVARLYVPEGVLHIKLGNDVDSFVIQVQDNPDVLPARDWVSQRLDENRQANTWAAEPSINARDFEDVLVGGQVGYAFVVSAFDHLERRIFVASGSSVYEITFPDSPNPNDPRTGQQIETFRQMLATFQVGNFARDQGFSLVEPQRVAAISDLNVPMFNQLDGSWKCSQLGTCTCGNGGMCPSQPSWTTVGSDGCAITSLAMVFNYYKSGFTNPGQINTCLTKNGGYAPGSGCGNCWVSWSSSCMPSGVSYAGSDSSKIDDDLRSGRPVVADIGGHYVVIIGKPEDGKYNINDPWGGKKSSISTSAIRGVRRYQGSSSSTPTPTPRPNRPPSTPSLQNPSDWYVSRDGRAPTLCWNASTDPDGDPVEYYAEVYESAVNANSGWFRPSSNPPCWRPGALDGRYYNYQWRVKAKDGKENGESGWSTTWHFTIEAPNAPPTISFATANGNGADQITSRDQNWTFVGTAHDDEEHLERVEFHCNGDACNNVTDVATRTGSNRDANWQYTRNGLFGQNDIYFVVFDDRQSTASRHLDLRIDLTAPATTIRLNGEFNPANWPTWFTAPVQVLLEARDNATGRFASDVREIRYQVDGAGWQIRSGASTTFNVDTDGTHTVEYYAVDNVGNTEGSRSVTLRIDKTPPPAPSGVVETHGVASDVWQRTQNVATFTWAESTDPSPGSGLYGYQFYFGTDPNGTDYKTFTADAQRLYTPQPGGVRTGTYYLRGRTRDVAGNWSAWTDLFTFRYDGTPPENPSGVTHAAGVANDTWQRITNLADFTWPAPHDEGSGVKDYAVYWGADPAGTSSSRIPNPQYQSPIPLCGTNEACIGYLRLRSRDNVDNEAEDWTTAFVLRYDNAPPTADFTFREGMTTTQTLVNLNITATDAGSGVQTMRFSGDGHNWTTWEVYTTTRVWAIPGISRQSWPVYLQVRDGVELPSEVVSHTIYLDVNPQQPRSAGFRLFDYALSAGSGAYSSTVYSGRGTLGQVMDSPLISNTQYLLHSGYEAGSQALPIVEPGHDEFTFVNGIFASGNGSQPMTSTLYALRGVLGEPGLPNNETVLVSQSHRHQPGFLAAALPVATPTPTPTPGPTPTPTPTPACEFPRVTINNAALFTNNPSVTLGLCAPWATEMMVSNDGGFGDAQWEPFAATKPWTITTYGQQVLPRFVYAAFKEANGTIHATYFDDIIYDPNAPSGSIAVGENGNLVAGRLVNWESGSGGAEGQGSGGAGESRVRSIRTIPNPQSPKSLALLTPKDDGTVDIYVNATDDNSGLAEIQVSGDSGFAGAAWEPYTALKPWTPEGGDGIKTVYARFKDSAGNVSAATDASFALDTMPPIGGIALGQRVVGPGVVTTTVYLGAEDNLTGVSDLWISDDPTFAHAAWYPYTTTVAWFIPLTGQTGGALYVQYRDWAGNVSEVYSDTYQVDLTPPQLYVEVEPGEALTRTVRIYAYDELAELSLMRLSNDPLLFDGLATLPYSETVTWAFDERRVVWVQLSDSVGNWTEPYPAYAALPEAPVSLALAANWNLIAIPRTLADPTLPAALDSITGTYNLVYAYDACDPADPWKKYDPTAPSFANDLTGMDVQRGYWLLTTQPVTLTVAGARPGATSIPLCAGWNLIGYPSAAPVMLPGALASIAGQYDLVYAYDAADAADPWKKYAPAAPWFTNDLAELGPGKGYWIRMTETGTMVVQ